MNNREKLKDYERAAKDVADNFYSRHPRYRTKEYLRRDVQEKLKEEYLKGLEDAYGHMMSTMNEVMLEAGKQLKETD